MDAVDGIKDIHSRMPVMIPQSRIAAWLSPENPYNEAVRETVSAFESAIV